MNSIVTTIFGSQVAQIMKYQKYIDARIIPNQLLLQISKVQGQKQLKKLVKRCKNDTQKLRILSIFGIIIIHSDNFYELIEDILSEWENKDDGWISTQFINPFIVWLKRCCETSSVFKTIKDVRLDPSTLMHRLPYLVNLLNSLLEIAKDTPKFGRYFDLMTQNNLYIMFSQVLMSISNIMYSHLKKSLQQLLYYEEQCQIWKYKDILKWIYLQILPPINQTMTSITLNKYFKLYYKGIATKMIRIHEYPRDIEQLIRQIIAEDPQFIKKQQLSSLQSEIFPQDGSFNQNLFLSSLQSFNLHPFTEMTNTCLSNPQKLKGKNASLKQNQRNI